MRIYILALIGSFFAFDSKPFGNDSEKLFLLTVGVNSLRNNEGTVALALYNRNDAFPDEHYKSKSICIFRRIGY